MLDLDTDGRQFKWWNNYKQILWYQITNHNMLQQDTIDLERFGHIKSFILNFLRMNAQYLLMRMNQYVQLTGRRFISLLGIIITSLTNLIRDDDSRVAVRYVTS
jgi:hypothetical protein